MAITDENTCLVIGAGVSAPFGLPLGGGLIDKIRGSLEVELNKLDENNNFRSDITSKIIGASTQRKSFSDLPYIGSIMTPYVTSERSISDVHGANEALTQARQLVHLLDGQTSETIDDFIVENPSYSEIVKSCIAVEFFKVIYRYSEENSAYLIGGLSSRRVGKHGERNWVHLLINIVRQGIREGKVSEKNKIKIITFNYDKILEYILDKQFSNTEKSYPDYREYIEILHVHGECGSLQDNVANPSEVCRNWAEGIHVVNEPEIPEEVASIRERAYEIVTSSNELYFCGFSFSGPNCRLLGLETVEFTRSASRRTITFCNYDGNVGISKSVFKYDTRDGQVGGRIATIVEEEAGTPDRPLGVSDWLKLGSLGELPG
jgi:hypothetical protein